MNTLARTALLVSLSAMSFAAEMTIVDRPDASGRIDHYTANRQPLAPSPVVKLPVGAIRPTGWLKKQLQLQADGFHGHLTEISDFTTGFHAVSWDAAPPVAYLTHGYIEADNLGLLTGIKSDGSREFYPLPNLNPDGTTGYYPGFQPNEHYDGRLS